MAFNFTESDDVKKRKAEYDAADAEIKNLGDFTYSKQNDYNKAFDAILNREKFSYDMNGDALYQQYKDQYTALGKLAMQDTMGQAAALTGGYGNSYAGTVGNQAHQGYMQQLTQMVPELYSLALQSYNQEGDRLLTNYNLLGSDRQLELGEHESKYNKLLAERSNAYDVFDNTYNREYTDYGNKYNADLQRKQFDWEKDQSALSAKLDAANAKLKSKSLRDLTFKFENGLITEDEFYEIDNEHRPNGKLSGLFNFEREVDGKYYKKYEDYVESQIETAYNNGEISEEVAKILLNKYNLY